MSKQKRTLSFFGGENKREEHRPQMETSRINNVDKDKLSDTDESEPFVQSSKEKLSIYLVGKIQVVAIRQHRRYVVFDLHRV